MVAGRAESVPCEAKAATPGPETQVTRDAGKPREWRRERARALAREVAAATGAVSSLLRSRESAFELLKQAIGDRISVERITPTPS